MLHALVLICSLSVTPDLSECDQHNAADVLRAPGEYGNPATCFMHAQAYLAESALEIGNGYRVKFMCGRK